jgi:hypothetical protein
VDFLLVAGERRVAIEVKATQRVHDEHLAGLRAIRELPGLRRRVLVCRAPVVARSSDGIDILPVAVFSQMLDAGELLA